MLTINNQYKIVAETIVVSKNGANQQQTQIGESHTAPVYKARILQKLIYGNKIGERRKQRTKNQEKNPQKFTHNNFIGGNGFGE